MPDLHLIEILIGLGSAMVVAIAIEVIRKPRLTFSIEQPPQDNTYPHGTAARFVRILVSATIPWKGTRWMVRAPASNCKAVITFHHMDGANVFGREMIGRWSSTPEPPKQVIDLATGQTITVIDPERLPQARIDIFPGESELLDIAAKLNNDAECYGWNNQAYLHAWRPPQWLLPGGNRYLVRIKLTSSGEEWEEVFVLVNDVARTDFRLDKATAVQKCSIR